MSSDTGQYSKKKLKKQITTVALSIYLWGCMLAAPFFLWRDAKQSSYEGWWIFGKAVAGAKAIIWPYYAVVGLDKTPKPTRDDVSACTENEKNTLRSLRFGRRVIEHELLHSGEAIGVRFDSTVIDSVGWGYPEKGLMVFFRNDSTHVYFYADVPLETIQGLLLADSVGKYFNNNIKGCFRYKRVSNGELQ